MVKSIIDHFYWHFIDVFQGAKGPQFWEGGHFAGCFLFLSKNTASYEVKKKKQQKKISKSQYRLSSKKYKKIEKCRY